MKSIRNTLAEILNEIGNEDQRIVVVDCDVSTSTRSSLFKKAFPNRFISVGISEQDFVGVAAGLAIAGKIPLACSFSMFLLRGLEQIRNTICKDNLNVKFIATHAGLSDYFDGYSHQSLEDITIFRSLPNMKIIVPADSIALRFLLKRAIEFESPFYIRLGRDNEITVYENYENFEIGKANVLLDGRDAYLISCGTMVGISLEVSRILKKKGFEIGVIDMHTIKPLDENILLKISKEVPIVFTIEEHNIIGGLGGAIAEFLSENKPIFVKRLGVNDRFGTCGTSYVELLNHFNLTPEQIAKKIEVSLNSKEARR